MIGIMGRDLAYSIPIYNTFKKFMPNTAAIILGYGLGGGKGALMGGVGGLLGGLLL